jgi:hypothetical protein
MYIQPFKTINMRIYRVHNVLPLAPSERGTPLLRLLFLRWPVFRLPTLFLPVLRWPILRLFCFLVVGLFMPVLLQAQVKPVAGTLFPRQYKVGDVYHYSLTTESLYNDKWNSTTVVVLELKVVKDSAGIPFDEVRHTSKIEMTPKDTVDKSAEARAAKPYRISLYPGGSLTIPPIEVPGLTGAITDFITFFVAVSPQSLVTTLQKKGDSLVNKDLAKGNFANGRTILVGDDCLAITARIVDISIKEVKLRTDFMPPATPCLTYLLEDMSKQVVEGVPNNFQMVQPAGNGKYNVQFGNEQFTINSVMKREDGKIKWATMSNTLQLKLRMNCDSTYKNCSMEVPFKIQRNLKLELLD